MHLETPSLGLCLRPASTAFALLLDLIAVRPKPLFCGVWELVQLFGGFVALEEVLGADAMSWPPQCWQGRTELSEGAESTGPAGQTAL